jgi:type IV pilus assembly protein PilA
MRADGSRVHLEVRPVRTSRGFTLIELLIAVVIIGLLASIAIPKFASTKDKAVLTAMKSDLRNLVTAEESFFAENVTYTSSLGTRFTASAGVTVTINGPTGKGWSASATHTSSTKTCTIWVGENVIAGQNEGAPTCH